jgi:hypothetical protein
MGVGVDVWMVVRVGVFGYYWKMHSTDTEFLTPTRSPHICTHTPKFGKMEFRKFEARDFAKFESSKNFFESNRVFDFYITATWVLKSADKYVKDDVYDGNHFKFVRSTTFLFI